MVPADPTSTQQVLASDSVVAPEADVPVDAAVDELADRAEVIDRPLLDSGVWGCFLSTFVTIFLAELGDKTQVATLLMSAQSHQPWVVFAGAASALVMTSLVGVLLGRWLSTRLTPRLLEKTTGVILAVVAAGLIWDVVQL
jgi:Ca2+/H+ antiporter, TMEM165/GDT1 family